MALSGAERSKKYRVKKKAEAQVVADAWNAKYVLSPEESLWSETDSARECERLRVEYHKYDLFNRRTGRRKREGDPTFTKREWGRYRSWLRRWRQSCAEAHCDFPEYRLAKKCARKAKNQRAFRSRAREKLRLEAAKIAHEAEDIVYEDWERLRVEFAADLVGVNESAVFDYLFFLGYDDEGSADFAWEEVWDDDRNAPCELTWEDKRRLVADAIQSVRDEEQEKRKLKEHPPEPEPYSEVL